MNLKKFLILITLIIYSDLAVAGDGPITVTAKSNNFDHQNGSTTYYGDVNFTQDDLLLKSDKLDISQDDNGKITEMVAHGAPAVLRDIGKAEIIKFYPEQDKVVFIDNAKLYSNGDIITGTHITYFLETGVLISKSVKGSRTTIILSSNSDKQTKTQGKTNAAINSKKSS